MNSTTIPRVDGQLKAIEEKVDMLYSAAVSMSNAQHVLATNANTLRNAVADTSTSTQWHTFLKNAVTSSNFQKVEFD
jgi:hypothetical protein